MKKIKTSKKKNFLNLTAYLSMELVFSHAV